MGWSTGPRQAESSSGALTTFCLCGPDMPHPRLNESAFLRMSFFQHLLHLLNLTHVQAARTGERSRRAGLSRSQEASAGEMVGPSVREGRVGTIGWGGDRSPLASASFTGALGAEQSHIQSGVTAQAVYFSNPALPRCSPAFILFITFLKGQRPRVSSLRSQPHLLFADPSPWSP